MKVPMNDGPVRTMAYALIEGGEQYAATLELPADFVPSITNDVSALETALDNHRIQKDAERAKRMARHQAILTAERFVANAIQVLKPRLGMSSNPSWEVTGAPQGSIAMPETRGDLLSRIQGLKKYLETNPTFEVAGVGVTAVAADAALKGMTDATGAWNSAMSVTRNAANVRDAKRKLLRNRLRIAAQTLASKLAAEDNLWVAFGLPRPVDSRIPEVPSQPTLRVIDGSAVELTWPKAVRATRYRVMLQTPGDTEPRALETVKDPNVILRDLAKAVKLTFTIVAANSSGESRPSEPVEVTLA